MDSWCFLLLCCSLATDFLPTFMYCMGSGNFDVVQTALRNLPEYVLLCQGTLLISMFRWQYGVIIFILYNIAFFFSLSAEHADILLHKAFLVGIYGQIDTSSVISESMKVLHMEATTWRRVRVSLPSLSSLPAFLTSVKFVDKCLVQPLHINNYTNKCFPLDCYLNRYVRIHPGGKT